jgi:hypothetical protein
MTLALIQIQPGDGSPGLPLDIQVPESIGHFKVSSLSAALTTDAGVANRSVSLRISDRGQLVNKGTLECTTPQTASNLVSYMFAPGLSPSLGSSGQVFSMPMPTGTFVGGDWFTLAAKPVQPGDKWSQCSLWILAEVE